MVHDYVYTDGMLDMLWPIWLSSDYIISCCKFLSGARILIRRYIECTCIREFGIIMFLIR